MIPRIGEHRAGRERRGEGWERRLEEGGTTTGWSMRKSSGPKPPLLHFLQSC
jgi:hypothetical protein